MTYVEKTRVEAILSSLVGKKPLAHQAIQKAQQAFTQPVAEVLAQQVAWMSTNAWASQDALLRDLVTGIGHDAQELADLRAQKAELLRMCDEMDHAVGRRPEQSWTERVRGLIRTDRIRRVLTAGSAR